MKKEEQENAKKYMEIKEILEKLFKTVANLPIKELKNYMNDIKEKIADKHTKFKQFSDLKTFLNTCKDGKEKTIIHFAASRGDIEVYSYLLEFGVDQYLEDIERNTPFFIAVTHRHAKLVKYMIEKCNIDPNQKRGNTYAIHVASSNHDLELLQYLLSLQNVDVNKNSEYGTPLKWAASTPGKNQYETIKFILEKGADTNLDENGLIPPALMLAADSKNLELFKLLLEYKANVNSKDSQGGSILQLCAELGQLEMLQILIEKGSDVNYEFQGKTALQIAFEHQQIEVVQYLRNLTKKELVETQIQKQIKENHNTVDQQNKNVELQQFEKDSEKSNQLKTEGNELFNSKNYEEALKKYIEATQYDNSVPALYTNIATCLHSLQRFQEVLGACEKAKKIDPKWIKAHFREGEAYKAMENYLDAAVSFWECVRLDQDNKLFKKLFQEASELGRQKFNEKK